MSINSPPDDRLWAWILDTLDSVGNITSIVPATSIVRDDYVTSVQPHIPRIEYNPFRAQVSEDGVVWQGQFGITVVCDRATGFGSGGDLADEGDLWTLETEVVNALEGVRPSTSDFVWSQIELTARRRPTLSNDRIVTRRLNFGVSAYAGTTVPLSGGDADVTGLGSNLEVVGWTASVDSTTHTEMTTAADTAYAVRTNRPTARVQIRCRIIGDGTTLFPAQGSRVSVTYHVNGVVNFTASTLISRIDWVPNMDRSQMPQYAIIYGIVDDGTSAFFTGTP